MVFFVSLAADPDPVLDADFPHPAIPSTIAHVNTHATALFFKLPFFMILLLVFSCASNARKIYHRFLGCTSSLGGCFSTAVAFFTLFCLFSELSSHQFFRYTDQHLLHFRNVLPSAHDPTHICMPRLRQAQGSSVFLP